MNIIIMNLIGRPGTHFFHSLLDSHPEIISFFAPYDFMNFFLDLDKSNEEIVDNFVYLNKFCFDAVNFISSFSDKANLQKCALSKNSFKQHFLCIAPSKISSHKELFEVLHIALALSLNKDTTKLKYIFVHLHEPLITEKSNLKMYKFITLNYIKIFYLILKRDFIESTYSMYNYQKKMHSNGLMVYKFAIFFIILYNSFSFRYMHKKSQLHKTLIVDISQLHSMQDKAMKQIADWLDITYYDSLCKSTVYGVPWYGNRNDGKLSNGFDAKKATETIGHDNISKHMLLLLRYFNENAAKSIGDELKPLSKYEKIYAKIFFWILFFIPTIAILSKYEQESIQKINKENIQNNFYKKLPLKLARYLIYLNKRKSRTKEFYRDFNNLDLWKKQKKAEQSLSNIRFNKEQFLKER